MSTKWTFVHVALYYEKRGFSGARVCGASLLSCGMAVANNTSLTKYKNHLPYLLLDIEGMI